MNLEPNRREWEDGQRRLRKENQQLRERVDRLEQLMEQLGRSHIVLEGQLKEAKEEIAALHRANTGVTEDNAPMDKEPEGLGQKLGAEEQKIVQKEGIEEELKLEKPNKAPVDPKCIHFNRFSVEGTRVTITGGKGAMLMEQIIEVGRVYSFAVKIIRAQKKHIYVGIVGRRMREKVGWDQSSYASYNCSGSKYPEIESEGSGFGEGDVIETVVDLANRRVQWKVNGIKQATMKSPYGKDTYVPFVDLCDEGDSVDWLGSGYLA